MFERKSDVANVSVYIVCRMYWCMEYVYNGTTFKILSWNTEQLFNYVHTLCKKEKKKYYLYCMSTV